METAILDTCVLYPDTLRDVLLRLAEADLFGPMWSELILDELHRNVAAAIGDDRAARLDVNLRRSFADSLVTGLEPLIASTARSWQPPPTPRRVCWSRST